MARFEANIAYNDQVKDYIYMCVCVCMNVSVCFHSNCVITLIEIVLNWSEYPWIIYMSGLPFWMNYSRVIQNKANLRDFIAATGLVILLKLDSNRRFFIKFVHLLKPRVKTGVTVRKCSIRFKMGDFLSRVTFKFDGWPWKIIGHLFYVASSFVHHLCIMFDLDNWWMTASKLL